MKNVVSLFDGISCLQIALGRASIPYENYYASEIDKHCITITQKNYPSTIEVGNICDLTKADFPSDIDLLVGGSPCQGFSLMGNQLNFTDNRSKLFFEYVRLWKELKPKYFILENVKMRKDILTTDTHAGSETPAPPSTQPASHFLKHFEQKSSSKVS